MKYTKNEVYNAVVFKIKGKLLGGPEAEVFDQDLKNFIAEGKKNIIVDLSDVGYVNSTGIGIIVRGYNTLHEAGGALKLAGLSTKIKGLLSITKLTSIFELFPDVEAAQKSFE